MIYSTLKNNVLKLIAEYSNRGTVVTGAKIADYLLQMQSIANDAIYDVCTNSKAKLADVYYITQDPVLNDTSYDTSDIRTIKPGDDDIETSTVGGKSYWFEAIGPGTVTVDEQASGSTSWSTLSTVTVGSTVTSFTVFSGLVTPTSTSHTVRLCFADGTYVYRARNYIVYPYTWASASAVQQHRPYFIYDMPTDYFQLNFIQARVNTRTILPFTDFNLRPDNKIEISRDYAPAEFAIHFWRKPTALTFTGTDATDDAQTIDATDDACYILPYFVAGQLMIADGELQKGSALLAEYEAKKAGLIGAVQMPFEEVSNVRGW